MSNRKSELEEKLLQDLIDRFETTGIKVVGSEGQVFKQTSDGKAQVKVE